MRKRLTILFFVILILLTACGPAPTQNDGKITITVMGKKTDMEKDYMQRIFQLYEQSGGGHLRIISILDYYVAGQKLQEVMQYTWRYLCQEIDIIGCLIEATYNNFSRKQLLALETPKIELASSISKRQ